MPNQSKLWGDPKVRAERQARAETFLGRPMELEPLRPPVVVVGVGAALFHRLECGHWYRVSGNLILVPVDIESGAAGLGARTCVVDA